ncbi:GNAT family N-acetyltransferase [Microbacterium sp. A196]|uniref:GNAT family N-acetyltransferase n=1 Tax=Microbacterium sp. A196 TaxID=3457320 RepID=UPI003FD6A355
MTGRMVVLHCNAGGSIGMGHLVRCLGLAALAHSRSWATEIIGDINEAGAILAAQLSPASRLVSASGAELEKHLREVINAGIAVIHFDTYGEIPELNTTEIVVSNMQDGSYGVRPATLAIDANLGAERHFQRADLSVNQIVGIDAAVVRSQVLVQRERVLESSSRPRLLVVIGGTDPNGLTARVIDALDRVTIHLDVTVVSVGSDDDVQKSAASSAHSVEVVKFVRDLPALARQHDMVISASGTSVWDFACMGLPMALICAVENQRVGYQEITTAMLAVGLGFPPYEDLEEAVAGLGMLVSDHGWLRRQAATLKATVDGRGAWRVVAAWEQLAERNPDRRLSAPTLSARPATSDDAWLLFDWRNDDETRARSRFRGAIDWDSHREWLERSLTDPNRRLFIVGPETDPVGTVRWDRTAGLDWDVSITVAPNRRGAGISRGVLASGERALASEVGAPYRVLADIHINNDASRRLFSSAGYLPHMPADSEGFERRAKWVLPRD